MKCLNVEDVQAFVQVAEWKSFTRAAHVLDSTQSAISLRIKRLEDQLGRRLVERTPRQVRLSMDGEAFVAPAHAFIAAHRNAIGAFDVKRRKLAIGISHHVIGAELKLLLRRIRAVDPDVVIEMRVAASRDILDAYDKGALDAAIVLQHGSRRLDGETIMTESFGWMATVDFRHELRQPLKLAIQAEPCSVRHMAIDTLDNAGISWMEAFVGGVATIGAAVSAGLAVAALGRHVAPPGTSDIGPRYGLPQLPARDVVRYTAHTDAQARRILHCLSESVRSMPLA